jgi:hypothetical protein
VLAVQGPVRGDVLGCDRELVPSQGSGDAQFEGRQQAKAYTPTGDQVVRKYDFRLVGWTSRKSAFCSVRPGAQPVKTDQNFVFRRFWSDSTSSRIATGSCWRCHRHSCSPAVSLLAAGDASRAALMA